MENELEYEVSMEYTKLFIHENTLVPKGAVQEKAIYKSANGKVYKQISTVEKIGNDEKLELHSIMYLLNKRDSHGNYVSNPKVLEDACVDFMKNGDKVVRMTHEGEQVEASVMQLYIVPEGHPLWKDSKYVGAIANVIKFDDKELYKYCKDNDFETSIGGEAEQEIIPVEKTNMFKKLYNIIINELKLKGVLPMGDLKVEKEKTEVVDEVVKVSEPAVVDETKPEEVVEPVKKEIPQEILDYCAEIVKTINDKFDAKYDELKAMIEGSKPESENDEIIEMKKSIKELKKAIASSSQSDNTNTTVKKVKTLLS